MSAVIDGQSPYMSVKQVADYLQLNEKKIYALVSDGSIPATKVTGKWMFPRELIDRWMLNSTHGGVLSDRLLIAGADDPLLNRIIGRFTSESEGRTLICYTSTGTRVGLELLQANRADCCVIHWGPVDESAHRHPALLQQYSAHHCWILIRALRREQGLMVRPGLVPEGVDASRLFHPETRWAGRPTISGAQRYFSEILSQHDIRPEQLQLSCTCLSEREAASAVAMERADAAPGTRAAASEFHLDFVSYGWEALDVVLPREIWFRRLFQELLKRIASEPVQRIAATLGGYDFSDTGELIWGDQ